MKDEMRSRELGIRSQGTETNINQTSWIFVSFVDLRVLRGSSFNHRRWAIGNWLEIPKADSPTL